ncbi:MAG: DeoR/GlpR family DNA-binding transcription regulator [Pseudomonadota bacterium]
MLTTRQAKIAEMVRDQKVLTVDALAASFEVTTQTIRRDVMAVCDMGLARRRHGRIEALGDDLNLSFEARRVLNFQAKHSIGRLVARQVPEGASIAFSIGTTPVIVAEALLEHRNLTIATNNLHLALVASQNPGIRIHVPGGELRHGDFDILGREATEFFSRFKFDIGIFGVGGVDENGALLDFTEDEVQVRHAIRDNSIASFLVLDRRKFGRRALVRGGHVREATRIFCDRAPEASYLDALKEADITYASPLNGGSNERN